MSFFRHIWTAPARFEAWIDSYSEAEVEDFLNHVDWLLVSSTAALVLCVLLIAALRAMGAIR